MILAGCSDEPAANKVVSDSGQPSPKPATAEAVSPTPDKDHQRCFMCDARGRVACRALGCVGGQIECPTPCLKLTRGKWEHMNVAGHSPDELWQKFPNGPGKWTWWNHHHVGEMIVVQNGVAANTGKCQRCGGTTKVKCPACDAQGQQACELCEGKKLIPVAWMPTDNPWFNRQPDLIRLKDGRVMLGRVATRIGNKWTIKTRDGKMVEVDAADVLPKAEPKR